MTKSELIENLYKQSEHLSFTDVEQAIKSILGRMSNALANGERIEIRGFGSFKLNKMKSRIGRNPKTGESVALPERYVAHFKPGKDLRDRVNNSRKNSGDTILN